MSRNREARDVQRATHLVVVVFGDARRLGDADVNVDDIVLLLRFGNVVLLRRFSRVERERRVHFEVGKVFRRNDVNDLRVLRPKQ